MPADVINLQQYRTSRRKKYPGVPFRYFHPDQAQDHFLWMRLTSDTHKALIRNCEILVQAKADEIKGA